MSASEPSSSSSNESFRFDERSLQQLVDLLNKQANARSDRSVNQKPKFLISRSISDQSLSILSSEQLTAEINQLTEQEYRISIKQLGQQIGVSQSVVEQAIKPLKFHRVYDDLITSQYISRLVEAFQADLLNPSIGFVSLTNQSISRSIPFDFLRDHIVERLHQSISQSDRHKDEHSSKRAVDFIQHGDTLYCSTLVDQQLERLHVLLSRTNQPVPLSSISHSISQSNRLLDWLVVDQIHSLLKSGRLSGFVHQSVYVPASFIQHQQYVIRTAYQSDQFIRVNRPEIEILSTYSQSTSQASRQAILASLCPNGLMLSSLYISQSMLDTLIESIEESIKACDYLTIDSSIIHCGLTERDFEMTVDYAVSEINHRYDQSAAPSTILPAKQLNRQLTFCQSVNYKLIVNRWFIDSLTTRVHDAVEQLAVDQLFVALGTDRSSNESHIRSTTQASKQSVKNSKVSSASKQLKGSSNQSADQSLHQALKVIPKSLSKPLLKPIIQSVIIHEDDNVSTLIDWLVGHFVPQMNPVYSSKVNQIIDQTISKSLYFTRSQWLDAFTEYFQDLYDRAVVFNQSVNILSTHPSLQSPNGQLIDVDHVSSLRDQLSQHLMKTICLPAFDSMLRYLAAINGVNQFVDPSSQSHDDVELDVQSVIELPLTTEQRTLIIQKLSKQSDLLKQLHESTSQSDVSSFLLLLNESIKLNKWPIIHISDAAKQQLVNESITTLMSTLSDESRVPVICLLVCLILFHQSTGCLLHCPARCVNGMMEWMKPTLIDDAYQSIKHLYASTGQMNSENIMLNELIEKVRRTGQSPQLYVKQ